MKNLIVYYSWTGNTEVVAKELHRLIGGDLDRIEEVKPRKGNIGFMKGAFEALFGMKSKIKQTNFPLSGYDNIYLGAQVWASKSSPAINSYIDSGDFKGKDVYLFITLADDKYPQTAIDIIRKRIEKRGGRLADSIVIRTVMNRVITPEEFGDSLVNWISKHKDNNSDIEA